MKLPELFTEPPTFGRAKSPRPAGIYCVVTCELDHRELFGTGGTWSDFRKVTFTVYGSVKADVVQGAGAILSVFNRNLGAPGVDANGKPYPTLIYPSGANFLRWMQDGEVKLEEDGDAAQGKDVWKATLSAKVWSSRNT